MNVKLVRITFHSTTGVALLLVLTMCRMYPTYKPIRQMRPEEIAQVWIGLTDADLYMYRIALNQDGTGNGGYIFVDREPELFRISTWKYDGRTITIIVGSETTDKISVLRGTLVGHRMELTVSGKDWKEHILLRPERGLEQRWRRLRKMMDEAENNQGS
jgi:hypothetical protein